MSDNGWLIDLNQIKAKEINDFQKSWEQINTASDFTGFYPWAARVVKKWPFALNPSNAEDYGELGLLDLQEVLAQLADSFLAYTKRGNKTPSGDVASKEERAAGQTQGAG